MSARQSRLSQLEEAHRRGDRVEVVAYDLGAADRTFRGTVTALALEHGGRNALKLVLRDDDGVTHVIGLTMIRSVQAGAR